jgi:ABC-type nitrate/sulfonate/bicarbonate transport system ATPase subunit
MKLESFTPVIDNVALFHPVDLTVAPGEIVSIMGASGIGKSSIFRAISGDINYLGKVSGCTRTWEVYQSDHQLFPWMSVEKNLNLTTSLEWKDWAKRWGLSDFVNRKPQYLSVGQRQRFTLIRAACSGVDTLLCDEALSGVDGLTSMKICRDIRDIAQQLNLKIIWVTHNIAEAIEISDRCLIIKKNTSNKLARPLRQEKLNALLL